MNSTAASSSFKERLLSFLIEWQPLLAIVGPLLVLISAGIAWRAISKNQDVNRRRATIDLIEKSESSEHYRTILATFRERLPQGHAPEQRERLHAPVDADDKKARRRIQQFLNHYELVSIGILGKSLHEKTYRSWMMTTFIQDWNLAADYIQRERWKFDFDAAKWEYHPRVYEGFERLAVKWGRKCGLKVTRISKKTSLPPETPSGAGDVAVPKTEKAAEESARPPDAANSPPSSEKLKKPLPKPPPKQPESR